MRMADWDRLKNAASRSRCFTNPFASVEGCGAEAGAVPGPGPARERTAFPRALIEKLPNLKFMVLTGARASSLDDNAASERGIPISNTPGGRLQRLDGRALLGALDVVRARPRQGRALDAHRRLARRHQADAGPRGQAAGRDGLGRLGSRVAGYGKAFGMDIVAWSQNLTEEKAAQGGAKFVTKDELLETSDFITIHLVLSARTRGLLGAADLAKMKKTAIW